MKIIDILDKIKIKIKNKQINKETQHHKVKYCN